MERTPFVYILSHYRHPELVSGSISSKGSAAEKWMLKQVQHDGF
jgi:hypothetical protein